MLMLPNTMNIKQAMNIRLFEARRVMAMIEISLLATEDDIENMNWADAGSLSHAVGLMEESARALGNEPDADENNG
jgi:hypothetical protein